MNSAENPHYCSLEVLNKWLEVPGNRNGLASYINRKYGNILDGRIQTADDIIQDASLNAIRYIARHGDMQLSCKFSSWFYAVVHNTTISLSRKKNFNYENLIEKDHVTDDGSPGLALDREFSEKVLREELDTLTPKYRDALQLIYFEDIPIKAAAIKLQISEGSFKSRLHRGKKELRQKPRINALERLLLTA